MNNRCWFPFKFFGISPTVRGNNLLQMKKQGFTLRTPIGTELVEIVSLTINIAAQTLPSQKGR